MREDKLDELALQLLEHMSPEVQIKALLTLAKHFQHEAKMMKAIALVQLKALEDVQVRLWHLENISGYGTPSDKDIRDTIHPEYEDWLSGRIKMMEEGEDKQIAKDLGDIMAGLKERGR